MTFLSSFSSWPEYQGLAMAILVQSQGIISFGIFGAKVAKVATVAMGLDHERSGASCLLDSKEICGTGTVLGSWGDFFVGIWFL